MADIYEGLQTADSAAGTPTPLPKAPSMYDGLEVAPTQGPPPPVPAHGIVESAQAGFQGSAPGLAWRGKLPDLFVDPANSSWWERAIAGLTQVGAEIPLMGVGGAAGGAAGGALGTAIAPGPGTVAGTVMGTGAGMFAVPAAIRESLIQAYKSGEVKTAADYWSILREVASTTAKEAAIGAATMGAGGLAARTVGKAIAPAIGESISAGTAVKAINTADTAAQIAGMVTLPAVAQGRLPDAQEFVDAAIVIAGVHAAAPVAARITNVFLKTGRTPAEQVADVQAGVVKPEDFMGPPAPIPNAANMLPASEDMFGRPFNPTGTSSGVPLKLDQLIAEAEQLGRGGIPEAPNVKDLIKEIKAAGPGQADFVNGLDRLEALIGKAQTMGPLDAAERQEATVLAAKLATKPETPTEAIAVEATTKAGERLQALTAKAAEGPLTDAERAERVFLTNHMPKAAAGETYEGTYSDGGKYTVKFETDEGVNGEHALVRTITDSDGTQVSHLDRDGAWKKGRPAKTQAFGAHAEQTGAERFPTREAALAHAKDVEATDLRPIGESAGNAEALARHFGLTAEAPKPVTRREFDASAERVHDDILQQLRDVDQARRDTGQTPLGDDHARAVAALMRARIRTRAERLKVLPEELYNEHRLQIKDEAQAEAETAAPPEGAQMFTPPEVDLFGNPVEVTNAPRLAVENMATQEVPLANLVLSKEVPQFKHAANDQGVIVPLGGKFDRTGVGPIQVWERKDGTLEVISGRHRLDLARRTGETTIPAQIHREADGFTARQAATLDAQLNIREEQGGVADYAQYFKDSAISKETADELGLLARAKGRAGFAIARDASPDLAAAHRAGLLSDDAALSISAAAPGSDRLQALGIAMVNDGKSILMAVNTMKAVELRAADNMAAGKQGDIFGFDDSAMQEAMAMAKKASSKQRAISEQIAAVNGASRRPELAKKMGVDVADPEGIQKRIVELRQEQYLWDNWPLHPELVAQLRAPSITGREGELNQDPVKYLSGMSMRRDFLDATTRGIPVGVDIGEMSKEDVRTLGLAIVNHQTPVFIDSGAFGNARAGWRGKAVKPIDFDKIFERYDAVLDAIEKANPAEETIKPVSFVMPDIVGDQAASLKLLAKYSEQIKGFIGSEQIRAIVPLQRGERSLVEAYDEAVNTLGSEKFIVGIPSNAAAATNAEVALLMKERHPREVHILGATAAAKLADRMAAIAEGDGQTIVTADANSVRSKMTGGRGRDEATRLAMNLPADEKVRAGNTLADPFDRQPLGDEPPWFDLTPETPAELKARDDEAAAAARRKVAQEKLADKLGKKTIDQADLFNEQRTLFQSKEPFYSELARQIEGLKQPSASAAQWKGTIKNLKGVKADEIEASGINDWLDAQGGKVTKEQVSQFLAGNGVKVTEVTLGAQTGPTALTRVNNMTREQMAEAYKEEVGYDPILDEPTISTDRLRVLLLDVLQQPEGSAAGTRQTGFTITPEVKAKALEGQPLFQQNQDQHRGSYDIAENLITTMQGSDKSTVLHELAHSWLEEMRADAQRPNAPESIKQDWEILRRELAIPEHGEIPRSSHEQWARSVERMVGEGNAPTPELTSVFARFREWLLQIYESLKNLNVTINPDVRAVFDRMLATDQDLADARQLEVPVAYVDEARATEAARIVPDPAHRREAEKAAPAAPAPEIRAPGTPAPPPEQRRVIEPGFAAEQASMEPYADALPKGPGEAPDNIHVNYDYINSPMDVKLAMQRMAEIDQANIQKHRGGTEGVKSWAEANAEQARYLNDILGGGPDTLKLFMPADPDAPKVDARLGILKKLAVGAAEDSAKKRDAVLAAGHDATIRQQLEYMGSIERARMIQAEFLGERASVARALNALKDTTEGTGEIARMLEVIGVGDAGKMFQPGRTPAEEQAYMKAKLDEIMQNYKGKTPLDIAKLHKEIGTLKGTFKLAKTVSEATTWEKLIEGWRAGLLSGPVTHTTNLFGTGAFHVMRTPVDLLSAIIGMARGAGPGTGESDRASMSDAVAGLSSYLGAIQDALKVGFHTFMADEATGKTEAYRTAIPGLAGRWIRTPLRMMGAEDAIVSTMYTRKILRQLAMRQAFDENLNPSTREFAERVDGLVDKPTPEMQVAADTASDRMTFNAPLGEKGVALQGFVNKWNLQWMIPFIRTPINIAKELARMSPFAPIVGEWRAAIAKGGVERDRALAELTLGTGIMALTMAYAFDGSISGAGSPDPGKNRGKAGVWQPYSVRIGDTWYEYGRIQPTGTLMGLAADMANVWDHMTDEEKDKVPKMLAIAFSNAVTNQTFLQGITNFVNASSDPTRFAPRFFQQLAGSMVPNVIGQPTTMADPYVREVNSVLEAIQARIPGMRDDLLAKRDWLGEPVQTKERVGVVLPSRTQDISTDKVRTEAARLDISMAAAPKKTHIGKGTGKIGDVELTPEERDTFEKVGGKMAHDILTGIVNAPGYDTTPDLIKRKIFAKVLHASHQVAAVQALPFEKRVAYLQSISEKVARALEPEGQQ